MEKKLAFADECFHAKQYVQADNCYTEIINNSSSAVGGDLNDQTRKTLCQCFNNRGQLRYLQVDFDKAIDDYTECLKIDQNHHIALYNRGLIHYRLGRFEKAINDFDRALSIKPDFNDATTGLNTAKEDMEEKKIRSTNHRHFVEDSQ